MSEIIFSIKFKIYYFNKEGEMVFERVENQIYFSAEDARFSVQHFFVKVKTFV